MDEHDDLDVYSGDAVHNMWVDFDIYENTGTPDVFDEVDMDEYIGNLNDCD